MGVLVISLKLGVVRLHHHQQRVGDACLNSKLVVSIMREIVLDTETTGLDYTSGDRVVEIGAVELLNHMPTGRVFHRYLCPDRDMPAEALAVHGLSSVFLAGKPRFPEIAADFLGFIADSPLVMHNANFDLGFLNSELEKTDESQILKDRAIDTVAMARRKFPGALVNLDALCRRFKIDISDRAQHGALKDARLLAVVYLELLGGRAPGLMIESASTKRRLSGIAVADWREKLVHPTADEDAAHRAFVGAINGQMWFDPVCDAVQKD